MFDNYNSQTYKKKTNVRHDKIKQVYVRKQVFDSKTVTKVAIVQMHCFLLQISFKSDYFSLKR